MSMCEDADPQTWSYAPGSGSEPSATDASPPALFQQTVPRQTADAEPLENVDELVYLAESITFRTSPSS